MKNSKNLIGFTVILGLLVAIVIVIQTRGSGPLPKEKKEFDAVTDHLDMGGNFLLYMKTDQIHERAEAVLKNVSDSLKGSRSYRFRDLDAMMTGIDLVYNESGIKGISGMGMSSAEIADGVYRNKIFLHKTPKSEGLIWNVFGSESRKFDSLKMLPANTVLASASEFDHQYLWKWLNDQVNNPNPEISRGFQKMIAEMNANGEIMETAKGFGTHVGLFVTMDESKRLNLPFGGGAISIPSPSACLFIELTDESVVDTIVGRFNGKMPLTERTIEGKKAYVMTANTPGAPMQISPTIVAADGYLLVSLTTDVVEDTLAVMQGKKEGLVDTDAFKLATKGMTLKGNSYHFISPEIGKTLKLAMDKLPKGGGPEFGLLNSLLPDADTLNEHWSFGTMAIVSDGMAIQVRSTDHSGSGMLLQFAGAPVAMGAGMMLPVLSKARAKAQRSNSAGNLKQMGLAMLGYSGDYSGPFPKTDGVAGLNKIIETNDLPLSKVYINPRDEKRKANFNPSAKWLTEATCSYAYVGGGLRDDNVDSTSMPIIWEKPCGDDWVNVLFIDGHVAGYPGTFDSNVDVVNVLYKKLGWDIKTYEYYLKKARARDSDK